MQIRWKTGPSFADPFKKREQVVYMLFDREQRSEIRRDTEEWIAGS